MARKETNVRPPLLAVVITSWVAWLGVGGAAAGEDAAALLEKTGIRGPVRVKPRN